MDRRHGWVWGFCASGPMNGARERRLFMATSRVELRIGVAVDAADRPLSRQQRYARTRKIADRGADVRRMHRSPAREN